MFGSAAQADDFDPSRLGVDLLVEFTPEARLRHRAVHDDDDLDMEVVWQVARCLEPVRPVRPPG